MHTIRTTRTFNQRTERARISAGWAHDRRQYHFMRVHPGDAPFSEPKSANSFAEALVGVVALAALLAVLLLLPGH